MPWNNRGLSITSKTYGSFNLQKEIKMIRCAFYDQTKAVIMNSKRSPLARLKRTDDLSDINNEGPATFPLKKKLSSSFDERYITLSPTSTPMKRNNSSISSLLSESWIFQPITSSAPTSVQNTPLCDNTLEF